MVNLLLREFQIQEKELFIFLATGKNINKFKLYPQFLWGRYGAWQTLYKNSFQADCVTLQYDLTDDCTHGSAETVTLLSKTDGKMTLRRQHSCCITNPNFSFQNMRNSPRSKKNGNCLYLKDFLFQTTVSI